MPVRIDLFRYDNRANPEDVNADLEWGWRTRFNQVAAVAELGAGAELKAQAMSGRTTMGFPEGERRWVDGRFRSAFVLLTQAVRPVRTSRSRGGVRQRATTAASSDSEYDDTGWSAMIAAQARMGPDHRASSSCSMCRASARIAKTSDSKPRQRQTQLQAEVRMHW